MSKSRPVPQRRQPLRRNGSAGSLRVSTFDRAAAWLIAFLVIVATAVTCLLIIWLTSHLMDTVMAPQVKLDPVNNGGSPDGKVDNTLLIEGPKREQIANETDALDAQPQKTIALITEALARKVADLHDSLEDENLDGGDGAQDGKDKHRRLGPPGPHDGDGGPAWEICYDESTLAAYAAQLDYFGVELAAIGGDRERIEYAKNFSSGKPTRRIGTREEEIKRNRTYFTHRSGSAARKYDRQLLGRAGIDADGKIVLRYYPASVIQQLLRLQQQFKGHEQSEIRRTVFGIRRTGNGYELYVFEQIRRG